MFTALGLFVFGLFFWKPLFIGVGYAIDRDGPRARSRLYGYVASVKQPLSDLSKAIFSAP